MHEYELAWGQLILKVIITSTPLESKKTSWAAKRKQKVEKNERRARKTKDEKREGPVE